MKAKQLVMPAIHTYMAVTVAATALWFARPSIAYILYSLGAGSGVFSFLLCAAETTPVYLGTPLFIWVFAFPIALVTSYILSWKGKYRMFYILLLLDTVVIAVISAYCVFSSNTYGFLTMLPDLIGSITCLALFTILLRRAHRNLQGAT